MTEIPAGDAPEILHAARGPVAWTVLNRPRARNALTFAMYASLAARAAEVAADPDLRAWVIAGAGGEAFAAGTDISQFRTFRTAQDALDYEARLDAALTAVEDCPKPVIAAVAGACTGGGLGLAGVADLRIAAANARFGLPIARTLGNCLSMANYARFAALIGPARLKEIIFTARLLGAEEALAAGLVTEVLPDPAALEARALELATHIAGLAPLTLTATKRALKRLRTAVPPGAPGALPGNAPVALSGDAPGALSGDVPGALSGDVPGALSGDVPGALSGDDLVTLCFGSEDFREGVDAFLAKRPPRWTGR